MMKYLKLKSVLAPAVIACLFYIIVYWIGCSKDSEDITGPEKPAGDLTGSWLVTETINGNCPDFDYPITRTDIFVMTQSGNELQIETISSGASFKGLISSDKVSWEMSVPESGGELSLKFSGTVISNGLSVTGQATWIWRLGNLSCSGTAAISASKLSQPIADVSGTWNGNWQSTTTNLGGNFEAEVIQQDTSLSGFITVLEIGLNEVDLKGTIKGNTIAFGDINDQITFIGVLGQDTLSASGTYYYPVFGDYGSWNATKSKSAVNNGLQILASFPIPGESWVTDMTYDGNNLWILAGEDGIYKFSTGGDFMDSYKTPGAYPVGITFDSEDLRVADSNWGNAKIFRLALDGNSVISAPGSGYGTGLTTDGLHLWVADDDFQNPQIYKIDLNGTIIDSLASPGTQMKGLTYDGQNLWLSARENADSKIFKLDLSGNVLLSFNAPAFFTGGLTFDGLNLWFSAYSDKKIYQIDTLGIVMDTINAPCQYAGDLAFDGTNLWVLDEGVGSSHKIYQMTTSGEVLSSIETPGNSSRGLTYYDDNIWNCNYVNMKIFKLNPYEPYFSVLPEFEFKFLTYDGANLWADDVNAGKIHQINDLGQIVKSLVLPCADIGGMVYHDSHFWIACKTGFSFSTLYQIDMNGNVIASYLASEELPEPFALTTDGNNLWYVGQEPFSWAFKLHKLALNQ